MQSEEKYIIIYDWMRSLGLRPVDLNVFALVFGYREDGSVYRGTSAMIARRLRCSDSGVRHALARLTDLGLIVWSDGGLTVPDGTQKTGDPVPKTCRTAQEEEGQACPVPAESPVYSAPDVTDGAQLIEFLQTLADDLTVRMNTMFGDPYAFRRYLVKTSDGHGTVRTEEQPTLQQEFAYEKACREYELAKLRRKARTQNAGDTSIVVRFKGLDQVFDPTDATGAAEASPTDADPDKQNTERRGSV